MKSLFNKPITRVILFFLVLIVTLTLPWWFSAIILAGLTIYIPFYPEVLFFGFVFDTLYGHNHTGIIIATVFLVVVMSVRTRIRT